MDGLTDTPGSVPTGGDGYLSGSHVAVTLVRPTRKLETSSFKRFLSGLASGEVYLAGMITHPTGGLLHHRFTLAQLSGLLSVALARGLPRVDVIHRPAL